MRQNPPNARFWVFWNDGWCKLTLKPGQEIELRYGGPTDEGWSSTSECYVHEGDRVFNENANCGCDCDGRLDRYSEYVCDLEELRSIEPNEWVDRDVMRPEWKEKSRSQRDYAAEAMGY